MKMVELQLKRMPNSWTRLLSYKANQALYAQNEDDARTALIEVATVCVAWLEDLDRKTKGESKWQLP